MTKIEHARVNGIYKIIDATDIAYVTLADLYGKDYQAEKTKQNKDSPLYNQHYTDMVGLQPIELMQEVLTREELVGFLKGNILKYTMRAGHKQGEPAEKDVAKAKQYQKWLTLVQCHFGKVDFFEEKGGENEDGTSEIPKTSCGCYSA